MSEKTYRIKNSITAPKSAGVESFLLEIAAEHDIQLNIQKSEVGWIFKQQTILFEARSERKDRLEAFARSFEAACEDYRTRIEWILGNGVSGHLL